MRVPLPLPDELPLRRLEFAAFSVKSMAMISGGNGIVGFGRGGWPFQGLALAFALAFPLAALLPAPVSAQEGKKWKPRQIDGEDASLPRQVARTDLTIARFSAPSAEGEAKT
jgi:hypothetical protein